MVFVRRPLESGARTLGERLRLLRRTQAVTMDMLVEATRIQRRYLEALEWGRYHELPDPLYTRNFIRAYARYLGADEAYFLELFANEVARSDLLGPHRLPRTRARRALFLSAPQILTGLLISFVFFLGIAWLASRIYVVFQPPEIIVSFPAPESVTTVPYVLVSGSAKDTDVSIRIQNKSIPLSPEGTFFLEVPLEVGPNIITISGRSRYSSAHVDTRIVVYQPVDVDN
jgi:cytoskeletal protein RodZ